mmetsp:Transcript_1586/g.5090  ORF Transcript_1586/g.5090 Transcript_1586/m.5090 type:complete len:196 (-) Transcript_1586:101-688(-)
MEQHLAPRAAEAADASCRAAALAGEAVVACDRQLSDALLAEQFPRELARFCEISDRCATGRSRDSGGGAAPGRVAPRAPPEPPQVRTVGAPRGRHGDGADLRALVHALGPPRGAQRPRDPARARPRSARGLWGQARRGVRTRIARVHAELAQRRREVLEEAMRVESEMEAFQLEYENLASAGGSVSAARPVLIDH